MFCSSKLSWGRFEMVGLVVPSVSCWLECQENVTSESGRWSTASHFWKCPTSVQYRKREYLRFKVGILKHLYHWTDSESSKSSSSGYFTVVISFHKLLVTSKQNSYHCCLLHSEADAGACWWLKLTCQSERTEAPDGRQVLSWAGDAELTGLDRAWSVSLERQPKCSAERGSMSERSFRAWVRDRWASPLGSLEVDGGLWSCWKVIYAESDSVREQLDLHTCSFHTLQVSSL